MIIGGNIGKNKVTPMKVHGKIMNFALMHCTIVLIIL